MSQSTPKLKIKVTVPKPKVLKPVIPSSAKPKILKPVIPSGLKSTGSPKSKAKPKAKAKANRHPGDAIFFDDHPEFTPNVTPQEMFELGVFGGTYYRPIYSSVLQTHLKDQHQEFRELGWWDRISEDMISSSTCNNKINRYGVKAGSSLHDWESKGWIMEQDPYGWVQWYCRFYAGRRSPDDDRQIDRWNKYTGPVSGRWKKNLVNKLKKAGTVYDDESISPVIRQGLLQWAYVLVADDLL